MTINTDLSDEFAEWLEGYAKRIWQLPDLLGAAVHEIWPGGIPGDEFPAATINRLGISADATMRAALVCLVRGETTSAAYGLMRGLIEVWAHIDHVYSGGKQGAACRAMAIELGMQLQRVNYRRQQGNEDQSQLRIAEQNRKDLEALRTLHECKGGSRSYGAVEADVKRMSGRQGLDWLLPFWKFSSEVVHMGGWDWMLKDQGNGVSAIVYPSIEERAHRLQHLIVIYNNISHVTLEVLVSEMSQDQVPAEASTRFGDTVRELLADPGLLRFIGDSQGI